MATPSSGGIGHTPAANLRAVSARYASFPDGVIVLVRRTAPRAHRPSLPPCCRRRDRSGTLPARDGRQRWRSSST